MAQNFNFSAIDKGLLRFCLEHSDGPKTDVPSNVPNRDPKDYQWLREALGSMEDDVQRMKRLLEVVKKEDAHEDEKAVALEELHFLVEDIDNANDLHKIDGFVPVLRLLQSTSTLVRMWAVWVIATVVQNNPYAQQRALEKGTLPRVINLFKSETDDRVIAKSLAAVSGLLRENKPAQELFLKHANGLELLASIICKGEVGTSAVSVAEGPSIALNTTGQELSTVVLPPISSSTAESASTSAPSTSTPVNVTEASGSTTTTTSSSTGTLAASTRMKAAFLLRTLLLARPELKDRVRELGLLSQLIGVLVSSEDADLREKVLMVLLEVVMGNPTNLEAVKALRLKEVLIQRNSLEGEESTEMDLCKALLAVL